MAKICILVEKIYEDLELQYPRLRLKEAGHTVDVVGPRAGETYIGKASDELTAIGRRSETPRSR